MQTKNGLTGRKRSRRVTTDTAMQYESPVAGVDQDRETGVFMTCPVHQATDGLGARRQQQFFLPLKRFQRSWPRLW